MKLAEALQERADINKKISELKRRLENCLLVQEGEEPAEDPIVLLNELDSATDRLEKLMASINETNCNTKAHKGQRHEPDRNHCQERCVKHPVLCV